MKYLAEYIWIDGSHPTREVRSKTRVLPQTGEKPGLWGFDGSSTYQAVGNKSDVVLRPVYVCPDPIRGGDNKLVLCETCNPDKELTAHKSNMRAKAVKALEEYGEFLPLFGLEQEYTLLNVETKWPAGFPTGGFPGPQGPYYCGVGAVKIHGRELIEEHTAACIKAGLDISGCNAEVMPGQWEFQIGPLDTVEVADQLWMARYILFRLAEIHNVEVSIEAKPMEGDWNGAGMHCNFSTIQMRRDFNAIEAACDALEANIQEHLDVYGADYEKRLTGKHETQHYSTFSWGIGDRGASVRVPWQVEYAMDESTKLIEGEIGYIEDRRPNANADPYEVTTLMTATVCEHLKKMKTCRV